MNRSHRIRLREPAPEMIDDMIDAFFETLPVGVEGCAKAALWRNAMYAAFKAALAEKEVSTK
jgi:hypothetical protein